MILSWTPVLVQEHVILLEMRVSPAHPRQTVNKGVSVMVRWLRMNRATVFTLPIVCVMILIVRHLAGYVVL